MYDINKCEKVKIKEWMVYIWETSKQKSVWYIELNTKTSLPMKNRATSIENIIQTEWSSVITIFDTAIGTNKKLNKWDKLKIKPEWLWHIHSNPFDKKYINYFYF